MCSAIDAIFGNMSVPVYSVVHGRSLERFGITLMKVMSEKYGSDLIAAREMLPEYVKAILEPIISDQKCMSGYWQIQILGHTSGSYHWRLVGEEGI